MTLKPTDNEVPAVPAPAAAEKGVALIVCAPSVGVQAKYPPLLILPSNAYGALFSRWKREVLSYPKTTEPTVAGLVLAITVRSDVPSFPISIVSPWTSDPIV